MSDEMLEVIEGEVVESGISDEIDLEIADFHKRMERMKVAYVAAAEMIGQGTFPLPPSRSEQREPGVVVKALGVCGKTLVVAGNWLLSVVKYSELPLESDQTHKNLRRRPHQVYHAVILPRPKPDGPLEVYDE